MANVVTNLLANSPAFEVLPSAARTTSPDTQEFRMDRRGGFQPVGLILTIDATSVTATPALTVTISRVDPVSGKVAALLATTAIATAVTTVLRIDPNIATAANVSLKDYVPPVFRIDAVHGDADSITYSIGGMLI
jgi:hypothetical protein